MQGKVVAVITHWLKWVPLVERRSERNSPETRRRLRKASPISLSNLINVANFPPLIWQVGMDYTSGH